jgi:hypothetical protein
MHFGFEIWIRRDARAGMVLPDYNIKKMNLVFELSVILFERRN